MPPLAALAAQRLAFSVVTLVVVSALIFVGSVLLPGDLAAVILGQGATPEAVAAIRRELGLDRPWPVRYVEWLADALRGEFGRSLASGRPVAELISGRIANSFLLAFVAAAVAVPLAVALGIVAALRRDGPLDRAISAGTLALVALPEFLIAYLLVIVFAVELRWLPALSQIRDGMDVWAMLRAVCLPALTLTLVVLAHTMRLARTAIVEVLDSDYVQAATLKGLSRARVVVLHAFPNALSPVLAIVMLTLAYLVVGVVVVEVVFNYPGMGKLMVDAVGNRDLPLIQACGLIFCTVYVVLNFLADFLSMLANPRLRHPR